MQEMEIQEEIKRNISSIKNSINEACKKAGRPESSVKILAASKAQSIEKIKIAANLGISLFGENYAREFLEKYSTLGNKINGKKIEWHFIGHLQRNKVKSILPHIDVIESLDSFELAEKINDRSAGLNKITGVFIEVNISKEDSKYGLDIEQIAEFGGRISLLDHICVLGFMGMPKFQISEMNRKHFKQLKEQFDRTKQMNFKNFNIREISAGTSNDYEIAIEEGSTIVRLGSLLLGERKYA